MRFERETVVVATGNRGKLREFAEMLGVLGVGVKSLADFAGLPDIVEDGATFAENALTKAKTIALVLNQPVLADDSGLCVDALGGAPGVYSARYAGIRATDAENNAKLLAELHRLGGNSLPGSLHQLEAAEHSGMLARVLQTGPAPTAPSDQTVAWVGGTREQPALLSGAKFVCALALYDPAADHTVQVEGECRGWIIGEQRGGNGFGYDPLFYLPQYGQTLAELAPAQKNAVSHRAAALGKLVQLLSDLPRADRP